MNANYLTREQAIHTLLVKTIQDRDLFPDDYDLDRAAVEMLDCDDESGWYIAVSDADFEKVLADYYIGDADYDYEDVDVLS